MRQTYWEIRGLGVEFLAVANEPPESHRELRERLDLPFSLLCDINAEVATIYGALHENEPRGRQIARPAMFLIDSADNGGIVRWEYVGPTSRHRVTPSRIVEEILNFHGQKDQVVSVFVPFESELERMIAGYQDPPLGFYRTPDEIQGSSLTERDFTRELAMAAYNEVHRLAGEGWTLNSVTPEYSSERATGQRYVFERHIEE